VTEVVSRSRLSFPLLCLAAFAEFVGVGITIPALPRMISEDLRLGDLAVGVAVGVFAIGALGIRPFAGRWGDTRGRRPLVIAGLLITAVPTAATGLGQHYGVLLALRVATGVGQALFFVGGATLAADLARPGRRGAALSVFSLPIYLGLGVGPAVGEYLFARHGAGLAFLVAGGLPVLALALAPLLPDHRPDQPRPDQPRPDQPRRGQRRRGQAAPAKGPLLHPAALGPGVVILLGLLGFIGFQAYLPLYADQIGLDRPELVFLLYSGIVIAVRTVGASVPDRLGAARTGTVASLALATGLATVTAVPRPAAVFIGTAVLAFGMALQYPALMSLAVGRAREQERAQVVSTFSGFFDLAQAGGGAVLGVAAAAAGYRAAFGCGALSALLGLLVLRLHVTRPGRAVPVHDEPDAYLPPGAD
jgi:predicted MFS family arabinose efflux permease